MQQIRLQIAKNILNKTREYFENLSKKEIIQKKPNTTANYEYEEDFEK